MCPEISDAGGQTTVDLREQAILGNFEVDMAEPLRKMVKTKDMELASESTRYTT
jgi:hypothetical protein